MQDALARALSQSPKLRNITRLFLFSITSLTRIPTERPLKFLPLTYNVLQAPQSSYIIIYHPTARVYSLIVPTFSISAYCLIISEVLQPLLSLCCKPDLWNGLPKTTVSHFILLTHLLISPLLLLNSPPIYSTHDWRPNSSSCPILILLLRHHTSTITTDCNLVLVRWIVLERGTGFSIHVCCRLYAHTSIRWPVTTKNHE